MGTKGSEFSEVSRKEGAPKRRRNRLLIIGINEYKNWQSLEYPVQDCTDFCQMMKDAYGFTDEHFTVMPLFDELATKRNVYQEIYRLGENDENGQPRIGPDENLIIFFSGHGHLDTRTKQGYWVLADSPSIAAGSDLLELLSVSQIFELLAGIKAHHILLIVDSCFSAAFSKKVIDIAADIYRENADPEEVASRWVLTAGRMEPVYDKSDFARSLVEVLHENRQSMRVSTLGVKVTDLVAKNHVPVPLCASLVDQRYVGGEFLFHYQEKKAESTEVVSGQDFSNLVQMLVSGSRGHLARLQQGRYRHLRIESVLLSGISLPDLQEVQVQAGEHRTSLGETLRLLWADEKPHAILFGDGGMGKTVSLLRLWEDLLALENAGSIPLFVPLHEFNTALEADKADFIIRYIARNYLSEYEFTSELAKEIWKVFATEKGGQPAVLLLLDGFNEITVNKQSLLMSLNRISEEANGVQIVVSSRFEDVQSFAWAEKATTVKLLPLSSEAVDSYLRKVNLWVPLDQELKALFTNPMMLTLFTGTSSIARQHQTDARFHFKPIASYGELLWNFNEAQLAKLSETETDGSPNELYHSFLLRLLVPYIANQMGRRGKYAIPLRAALDPAFNFSALLDEAFLALDTPDTTALFPEFSGKKDLLGLGVLPDFNQREQRAKTVRQYLVEKLRVLVLEGDDVRFLHQNFRDFYAVCHLRNGIRASFLTQSLPTELAVSFLPVYLLRLLGEVEGEHQVAAIWQAEQHKLVLSMPEEGSLLTRLLDRCRKGHAEVLPVERADKRHVIRNIIVSWLEVRQTLAGADLTDLDLSFVNFNAKSLTTHYNGAYLPARFDGSILSGSRFTFTGHYGHINTVCYNLAGTRILTVSDDKMVKEWLVSTGENLMTFSGHTNFVNSVCYSGDEKRILTGSVDTTIREWDVNTGQCIRVYSGHGKRVTSACYSPDGTRVLSSCGDGLVKEWAVESGHCIKTYGAHKKAVTYVCYNTTGDRFISASNDMSIKEWQIGSHIPIRTFVGHSEGVNQLCYKAGDKYMLSASDDGTIMEWSLETDEPVRKFIGHKGQVLSVCYSPDQLRILSACADKTIKEWLVESTSVLLTFTGHQNRVNCARYSHDGRKVISVSDDKTVHEWSTHNGQLLQVIEGQSNWVSKWAVNPQGNKVITVNYDKTISEVSVQSGICLQTFRGHTLWIRYAAYSADGSKVISTSDDMTIREWSVSSGQCIRVYSGHTIGVEKAVYSEDGSVIHSISFKNEYKTWSVASGVCLSTLDGQAARAEFEKVDKPVKESALSPRVKPNKETIQIIRSGHDVLTYENVSGLLVQGCDFRHIDPSSFAGSSFSEEIKRGLRSYGAWFTDEDKAKWEETVKDAFG